jgi:hypothetical protein
VNAPSQFRPRAKDNCRLTSRPRQQSPQQHRQQHATQSAHNTALFSLATANPNQNAQLLNFGGGYFGWEDLAKGRDAGYDGDFNDLTST